MTIDSSSKVAMPAKLDWSKPIRRTDTYHKNSTFTVITQTAPGLFPVIVMITNKPELIPTCFAYRLDGSQGSGEIFWENIPEEEWTVIYYSSEQKKYLGPVFSTKNEVVTWASQWVPNGRPSIIRLSDGYREPIT